eukprot:TRINITY_DN3563_c1_g1_i1.p1 TRINITY_DN3563_c1_g1~~TRINITY_DN3563_c1_g1_i1.p1  ORF type:complete len:1077 (+),score=366.82 TRINITY_DN3563_c1_g1_i1:258-3488(+)
MSARDEDEQYDDDDYECATEDASEAAGPQRRPDATTLTMAEARNLADSILAQDDAACSDSSTPRYQPSGPASRGGGQSEPGTVVEAIENAPSLLLDESVLQAPPEMIRPEESEQRGERSRQQRRDSRPSRASSQVSVVSTKVSPQTTARGDTTAGQKPAGGGAVSVPKRQPSNEAALQRQLLQEVMSEDAPAAAKDKEQTETPKGSTTQSDAQQKASPRPPLKPPADGRSAFSKSGALETTTAGAAAQGGSGKDAGAAAGKPKKTSEEGSERKQVTHVYVAVRCRPLSGMERITRDNMCVKFPGDHQLTLKYKEEDVQHMFDHVFKPETTQLEIFQAIGMPLLDKAFDGFNSTIFAYGQTGAGKTHTMVNNRSEEKDRGIIPRISDDLFRRIAELQQQHSTRRFLVQCSFLEIYNEIIFDLLAPKGKQNKRGGLEVREQKGIGIYVKDLMESVVEDPNALGKIIQEGFKNRATGATKMNDMSSRSHVVFTIKLHQKDVSDTSRNTISKVNLVDLAGSERVKSTEAEGIRLTEGVNINKSLSALGNVINALSSMATAGVKTKVFVPYRDSKLTRVLQESLGGNCLCTMIANISPSAAAAEETNSTLNYARRAKVIKVVATRNEQAFQIERLQQEVEQLRQQQQNLKITDNDAAALGSREKEEILESHQAQIATLESFMQQSWEDKQRLSQQCEEERKKAQEEAQRAAQKVQAERRQRLQLLRQGELQLTLQALLAADAEVCAGWVERLSKAMALGQQLRAQIRTVRLYRDSVATDLLALWGCCSTNASGALVLLGQVRVKLETLAQEMDSLASLEAQLLERAVQVTPEMSLALQEAREYVSGTLEAPDSKTLHAKEEVVELLCLTQEQLAQQCNKEITALREDVKQLGFAAELKRLGKYLSEEEVEGELDEASPSCVAKRAAMMNEIQEAVQLASLGVAMALQPSEDPLPCVLGLSTMQLEDARLSASSSTAAAASARLLQCVSYGGWCASRDSPEEFLELDVAGKAGTPKAILGLSLQGRLPCSGHWQQTRDLLGAAFGTGEGLLLNASEKTFMRPPVRFVHEVSVTLLSNPDAAG